MPLFHFISRIRIIYTLNALFFLILTVLHGILTMTYSPPFREGTNANAATPNRDEMDYDNDYARTLRVI